MKKISNERKKTLTFEPCKQVLLSNEFLGTKSWKKASFLGAGGIVAQNGEGGPINPNGSGSDYNYRIYDSNGKLITKVYGDGKMFLGKGVSGDVLKNGYYNAGDYWFENSGNHTTLLGLFETVYGDTRGYYMRGVGSLMINMGYDLYMLLSPYKMPPSGMPTFFIDPNKVPHLYPDL